MDAPRRPYDQPREAAGAPDAPRSGELQSHLAALGECLRGEFDVELTGDGLVVLNRNRAGSVVTIICRRRSDDGERRWFFASCGEPIAEVDRIPDTVVAIHGYLTGSRP